MPKFGYDSSDDEDEGLVDAQSPVMLPFSAPSAPGSAIHITEVIPSTPAQVSPQQRLPEMLGIDCKDVEQLRDSFFPAEAGAQSEYAAADPREQSRFPLLRQVVGSQPASAGSAHGPLKLYQDLVSNVQLSAVPVTSAAKPVSETLEEVSGTKMRTDAALYMGMGRSFRCSWGPNGEFVRPQGKRRSTGEFVQHGIAVQRLNILGPGAAENSKSVYVAELEIHLQASQQQRKHSGTEAAADSLNAKPFRLPDGEENDDLVRCIHRYMGLKGQGGMFKQDAEYRISMWKLVNALFGQVGTK